MNITIEQILLIILIVFLLYFVMNNRGCNIEGMDTCLGKVADSCELHYTDCDNRYTVNKSNMGFHGCTKGGFINAYRCISTGKDCMYGSSTCDGDTCVDVRPFGAKIGDTRPIAGQDEAGKIKSVNFHYYKPKVNTDAAKPNLKDKEYATIKYYYESDDDFSTEEKYDENGRSLWNSWGGNYVFKENTPEDTETWQICKSLFEKLGIVSFEMKNYEDGFRFEVVRYFKKASTIRIIDGSGDYYDIGYSDAGIDETEKTIQTNWVDFTSDNSKIQFLVLIK